MVEKAEAKDEMCWKCVFWNYGTCGNPNVRIESFRLEKSVADVIKSRMENGLCVDASTTEPDFLKVEGENNGLIYDEKHKKWRWVNVGIKPTISSETREKLRNNNASMRIRKEMEGLLAGSAPWKKKKK